MRELNIRLTLEQQFQMRNLEQALKEADPSKEQLQGMILRLIQQLYVKNNLLNDFLKADLAGELAGDVVKGMLGGE